MAKRPTICLIGQTLPAAAGTGSDLRLRHIIRTLSCFSDLHLIMVSEIPPDPEDIRNVQSAGVIDVHHIGGPFAVEQDYAVAMHMQPGPERLELLRRLSAAEHMMGGNHVLAARILEIMAEVKPDAVHFSRVNLMQCNGYIRTALFDEGGARVFSVLDMDDDETISWDRIAEVQERYRLDALAMESRIRGKKVRAVFESSIENFSAVTVCSNADAERLSKRYKSAKFDVIANVYPDIPLSSDRLFTNRGPLNMIFVGHLSYVPNIDAIEILTRVVAPGIQQRTGRDVRLTIAGRRGEARDIERWRRRGATVHESPPDLDGLYASAHVAVTPIRAGGGTRIKILEAFAHGVPVVSTPIGIEGLDAMDGQHALIRDSLAGLVDGAVQLADDPELCRKLAAAARRLVAESYGLSRLRQDLRRVYAPVL